MDLESPFKKYCDEFDLIHMDASPQIYFKMAYSIPRHKFRKMIFDDFRFREKYQGNVVVSNSGEQGSGKSLFLMQLVLQTAKIFRRPFKWSNLSIDISRFNQLLREGRDRDTFFLDEQTRGQVGIMSTTANFKLAEYEEQCRQKQQCIFYASPKLRQHEHYFVLNTERIDRVYNPVCVKCPFFNMDKIKDPTNDREVKQKYCLANRYKTMCENNPKIPHSFNFTQRHGYPKSFLCLLKTRSKFTDMLMPRGILEMPMVSPDSLKKYQKKKEENLKRLSKEESADWAMFKEAIEKLWEKNKDDLVVFHEKITNKTIKLKNADGSDRTEEVETDNSIYKPRPKKYIETLIYDEFGLRKYTKEAVDIISTTLHAKADKVAQEKNKTLR